MTREYLRLPENQPTEAQEIALKAICERYDAPYDIDHYLPAFDLPEGFLAGWVGGPAFQEIRRTIFIGVSPEGQIHS